MKQTVMEGIVAETGKKLPKTFKKEKVLTGFFFFNLLSKFVWVLSVTKQDNIHFSDWHFGIT